MIYLDNASTTHIKPKCVKRAVVKGIGKLSVNASRGGYDLATKGGMEVLKVREKVAKHYNTTADNVIFTSSCTMAINTALRGTIKKGGHIVATTMEHNSVLRTLNDLKQNFGIDYTLVEPINNEIRAEDIEKAIKDNTYLICTIHTSNVTGDTNNISEIGKVAHKHKLLYMVDCAQSSGHLKVDMQKDNINLVTIAGHKGFFAPQGIGLLLLNNCDIKPIITGGTGTYSESIVQPTGLPEGLESGTLNMPCILGLGAGISYVEKHYDRINWKIKKLTNLLYSYLKNNDDIELYSSTISSGVMSFNIKGFSSSEVGDYLSEKNICVRTGLQCAPLVHKNKGTLKRGMMRVSLSGFNKTRDIKALIIAIEDFIMERV